MAHSTSPDVFVDLCIQREYVGRRGAHRCKNAGQIARNLKHLIAFARWAKVPVLSCVDAFHANTIGQRRVALASNGRPQERKLAFTLLPKHIVIESDNCLCVSLDLFKSHQQAIFTKVHHDPFTNPKFDRLLTELPAERFIAFGLPIESSLRILVLGLLRRHRRVVLIEDACGYWNEQEAAMALRQLDVKGCRVIKTAEFLESEFSKRRSHNGRGKLRCPPAA